MMIALDLPAALPALADIGDDRQPGLTPHFHGRAADQAIDQKLDERVRHGDETRRNRHEHRPGDENRPAAHAIDENAGRHGGEQPAQGMHDDHQGSDAEAGVEGFRK